MGVDISRERAAELLLGKGNTEVEGLSDVPPYLRARTARRAALCVLGEQNRPTSLELGALIHAATRDKDVQVRASAVSILARQLAPALAAPVLLACAADGDEPVRAAAREALARLPSEEARVIPLPRVEAPARPAKLPRFIGH